MLIVKVRVGRDVIDEIVQHAADELPNECCGLLVGAPDEVAWTVRSKNLAQSPTRFLVDPEAHFRALRLARAAGLAVVGAYHSHPVTEPVPSAVDRAEVSDTDFLYLIVSPGSRAAQHQVRLYLAKGGNFEPVDLVLACRP
jgi:proteasome lid subunit RPN8/RPN11